MDAEHVVSSWTIIHFQDMVGGTDSECAVYDKCEKILAVS
jgi:hypothetical protein